MLLCRNSRQFKRVGGCENAEQRNKDIKYRGRSVQVAWTEEGNEVEESGGVGRKRGMERE